MIPRATYRLQFNRDFPFASAEALVDYLARLGVSHIYASPITKARSGSMHGYDVVDPTRINPELGGEQGFRSLVDALCARGMGIIIDIVPNHMGIAGDENRWWLDVLAKGRESRWARFFDIDWNKPIMLPILGEALRGALANGAIRLEGEGKQRHIIVHDTHRLPLRPDDGPQDDLEALLARQHYRLTWWRSANDELNWRRFFAINELAAVRVEDPVVFEETHALYFRLYEEGLIDGLRVDHVDGLTDPEGYCRQLRRRFDAIAQASGGARERAYIIVEKILAPGERLQPEWNTDGTSGYDFMEDVGALLHDPEGAVPLADLWQRISGEDRSFEAEELRARRQILSWQFEGQLSGCVTAFAELARSTPENEHLTDGMIRRAIERMLWVFPVYRTYGTGKAAPESDAAVRELVRSRVAPLLPPGEAPVMDLMLRWLAGTGPADPRLAAEAVRRFEQLSAPIAAKAVEDTAFYRYGRLLSRNDVGSDPGRFAMDIDAFQAAMVRRAGELPHSLLATATHDHKRGEDVRMRLAVLGELHEHWAKCVHDCELLVGVAEDGVHPADRYMLYQSIFGAWPDGLSGTDEAGLADFAERLVAWQRKALREAKLRSSWEAPDEAYEGRCADFTTSLFDRTRAADFIARMEGFVGWTAPATMANILVQLCLRYMAPGVPDLYQGCELADFSLVDPDNRRPVDYALRQRLLNAPESESPAIGAAKLRLLSCLLALRREQPGLFEKGSYEPVLATGQRARHILAFRRRAGDTSVLCAVQLRTARALAGGQALVPPEDWWGETSLLTGDGKPQGVAEIFADEPCRIILQP